MINLSFYSLVCVTMVLILYIGMRINFKTERNKEKSRAFERGFDPAGNTRVQFCMKFFLVGVIFLIFDVEVSLVIPLPFSQTYILLFLFILIIGLIYE